MNSNSEFSSENVVVRLWFNFLPYWPIFLVLMLSSLASAWIYLQFQTPLYEATSSILIKDDKKGADDSKITESLDYLSSKKILENEIEILRSKKLLKEVVYKLSLYAPVYKEANLKSLLAHSTSPILIQAKNPDSIKGGDKIYFDITKNLVVIEGQIYLLNQWVKTRFGSLRFVKNSNYKVSKNRFYVSLNNPRNTIASLLERLDVAAQGRLTSIVILKLKDESPKRAEEILNALIDSYNEISVVDKNNLAINTLLFLETRLKNVKGDLDSIEGKIQQYKSNKGAINVSKQGELYLQNVSSNDQKLSEINIQLSVLNQIESNILSKEKYDGIVPSMLGVNDPNPTLTNLVNQLYTLQFEYERLKKTTAENNPILISITDRIEKVKPSILGNISSQRRSLQASKNNLYSTNSIYSNIIQTIPQKERDLLEISREQSIKTNIYNFLLQKYEETALSNSKIGTEIRVVNAADASLTPVSPRKSLIYLAFVLAALIIGVSAVYAKEVFNRTILFRNEIENSTSFPIIGEIGYEKSNNQIVIENGKPSIIVEQFRKLRISFQYLGINTTTRKKILITSTISGEGKSFTAVNLGLTLAAEGKKVIILEADLRKPTFYKKLDITEKDGISNYLLGELSLNEILKQTEYPNLTIIPSGPFHNNSSALFLNGRFEVLLSTLEGLFDYIIIDSAPAGLLSDAYILSPLCDATLYVVRHKYTPKICLKELEENDRIHKFKNLAIIFNGVHKRGFTKNDYGYGYGSGSGSGYVYTQNHKNRTRLIDIKNG